jgi:hypothetical protein
MTTKAKQNKQKNYEDTKIGTLVNEKKVKNQFNMKTTMLSSTDAHCELSTVLKCSNCIILFNTII